MVLLSIPNLNCFGVMAEKSQQTCVRTRENGVGRRQSENKRERERERGGVGGQGRDGRRGKREWVV